MSDFHDERIASFVRLVWQIVGAQDSNRPNFELHNRFVRELERDFPGCSPSDRERAMTAIRRATCT